VTGRSFGRLRADRPLVSPADDRGGEAPGAERGDDQPAARVGGIRLGMAGRTERHQPVEVEVRAPLGALDDVVAAGLLNLYLASFRKTPSRRSPTG
jgi:hypothetical protein